MCSNIQREAARRKFPSPRGVFAAMARATMRFPAVIPLPFLCLFLAAAAGTLRAQLPVVVVALAAPSTTEIATTEIVQRAVANDELRRQHRLGLESDQTITTERLDETGKVFKTKTVHVLHRESREFVYSADVDSTSESAGKDGDTAKAQHLLSVMNLRKLAPRFRFTLAGEDRVRGRACFVVAYAPKGGQTPNTREEKVINNLHGRYWIDRDTFEILQGEGSLASPVTVGLIASVTRMDFRFHSQTLPSGEAGPSDFSVDLTIKAPLYFYRQRQTSTLTNWRAR